MSKKQNSRAGLPFPALLSMLPTYPAAEILYRTWKAIQIRASVVSTVVHIIWMAGVVVDSICMAYSWRKHRRRRVWAASESDKAARRRG